MNQAKETNNPVKEYKEKIKRLNQKELIKAFNNANPDRVKSKEEKEKDEYFEAKKKALKEYYDSMVAKVELDRGIELARYIESSKSEKKSVIKKWIKQHNVTLEKDKEKYMKLYRKAYYELNKKHIQEIKKKYYELNKDKFFLYNKNYVENNLIKMRDYHREYIRKYRNSNKNNIIEKSRNRQKIYRQKNKEKIREAKKIYNKEYLARPEVKNKRNSYDREKRAKLKALKLQQATQEIKEGV